MWPKSRHNLNATWHMYVLNLNATWYMYRLNLSATCKHGLGIGLEMPCGMWVSIGATWLSLRPNLSAMWLMWARHRCQVA
jgi:hypothetical protein